MEHYGSAEAYLPFLDAIRFLLSGSYREQIITVLKNHAPTWYLQFQALIGSTRSGEHLQQENIGGTRERMMREFCDAMEVLCASAPVVLVLEDLHWSDVSTVDLLRYLCSRFMRYRLLVLGTFRDKETGKQKSSIERMSAGIENTQSRRCNPA